ncbi:alpha/beta fold hydrolase [Altererythrobacter salegens]|uniref:Alpha/beta fold hydrolase n=1 Tax=Croceibacterium salegens TaxID=1737568 RepID=A0A6I4SYE8_9SPHN|nr:S9 family peptidase [Croceibacterium salegens]MXO61134.1 alpha/beta fold hydrolase [Croceibacterium salegens]
MSATAIPVAAERPAEYFATPPRMSNPVISPSGKFVAAEMSLEGKQQLVIIPTDRSLGAPVLIGAGDYDLWDLTWVNDDWILVQTGIDGRVEDGKFVDGAEVYISRYVAFRTDGKEQHVLQPKLGKMLSDGGTVIWTAKDGSPEILLQYRTSYYTWEQGFWPQVMRVDVAKNSFKLDTSPIEGIQRYYADADGVVRVGIGSEKEGIRNRFVYRSGPKERLKEVASVGYQDDLLAPRMFYPDGKTALTVSTENGVAALRKLDLATMTLGDAVFHVDGYDLDAWYTDDLGSQLRGVRWIDQMPRYRWFSTDMQQLQSLLDQGFPGRLVQIVSSSRDYTKHVISVGTPSQPASYYIFDATTKKVSLLAKAHEELSAEPNGPVSTVVYTARDGLKIQAVLTLPPGKEAKNLPLILLPHGGPQSRDYERWDWWSQFLADRGYAVLQPNYRGSAGFGEGFLEAGDGEWGLKMQDDIVDAKKWAVEQGLADPGRVCVVGASYGGYVAMRAAQRDSVEFRCAVSFAGVSDLPAMLASDRQSIFGKFMKEYWENRTGDLAQVSPIKFPEQFGAPILLVHGKEDLRVPVEQSRDLNDVLKKAHKQVEYVEQPEGDHHFTRTEDRLQFLQVMEAFLDRYNPAD